MAPPVVTALVLDGANPFEVAIAAELFGIPRGDVMRRLGTHEWYELRLAGERPGTTMPGLGGSSTTLAHGLEATEDADVVVLPVCRKPPDAESLPPGELEPMPVGDDVLDALRRAHDRGATVMSYCSGSFALAEAGILDGRPATTHWMYANAFRRRFPRVRFTEDVLYVDDGDVLTSAGSAAGIDLTLHWLRREHGAEIADMVARRMVVPPHRDGGQAQYVSVPAPETMSSGFGELLDWLLERLDEDLTVDAIAAHAAMSPRSLARHFRAATGTTPHQWLTDRRVEQARRLLETTDLSVDRVADASGLGSAANLRTRLRDAVGVTPTAYRQRFART